MVPAHTEIYTRFHTFSLPDALTSLLLCAVLFTHTARRAPRVLAPEKVSSFPLYVKRAEIRYEPYGVVERRDPGHVAHVGGRDALVAERVHAQIGRAHV